MKMELTEDFKINLVKDYVENFLRFKGLLFTSLELSILEKIKNNKPLTNPESGLMTGWAEDMEDITFKYYLDRCALVEKQLKDKELILLFYKDEKIVEFQELIENCLDLSRQILRVPDQPLSWKWGES